ncbi:MAG: response regulator transcription factor [Candidatus Aminicenantes bacterium]|nr:response regulator transcription factor [Candidatus Aminicenantes bacterium]
MNKIIIVDDHPIFRSGLKQILNNEYDMEVTGEAENARELYQTLEKVEWDLVVLDISLPGESGIDILKELKYRHDKVPVLVLSNHPESQYGVRSLKAGASGYMTKEAVPRELVLAIRRILTGRKYISADLAERLADNLHNKSGKPGHEKLSDREFQVMCMLGSGKTVGEIAEELLLSVQTVSTYRARVLQKMNMKTTAEVTRYVIENHL